MINFDASAYQLGCTLLQEHDEPTDWHHAGCWYYLLNDRNCNYSATERECFDVAWAVPTLQPYIEGTKYTVDMDQDALRWLMPLTESSGRLTRWRLRLAEYDFTIQYRSGRVHQVPDALLHLISLRVAENHRPVVEIEKTFPTLDAGTMARDVFRELAGHVHSAKCEHKGFHVFNTTRNRTATRGRTRALAHDGPRGDDETPALQGPD